MPAIGLNVGCCQVMVRQIPCDAPETPYVDCLDPEAPCATTIPCEATAPHVVNFLADAKARLACRKERFSENLRGWSECSSNLSDRMHSSRLAQWADMHRMQANAPPSPRFHPVPTYPVFHPEDDMEAIMYEQTQ